MADNLFYTDPGSGAVVRFRDDGTAKWQGCDVEGAYAHDAAASSYPVVIGGCAYAAAPSDVSADGDAAKAWCLRNGSFVINLAVGGTLVTGSAGLPVAQQGTWNIGTVSTVTNVVHVDDNSSSLTIDAPVDTPAFVRLSDGASAISTLPVSLASVPSHAVTNAGTFAVQPAGSVAHDGDASSVNPTLVGGYAKATAPSDVSATNDSVRAWFQLNGSQCITVTAAGALIGGDATNGLDVDVTRVKPDGTNTMPSLDAAARRGYMSVTDGTNTMPTMDAVGRAGYHIITNGSISAGLVSETGSSAVNSLAIGGGTPHDSVDSGNPQKIGYKAIDHGSNPTAVAAADRSDAYCNRHGIPFVIGGHPNIITLEYATTGSQTNTAIITVSSGTKIVVTQIQAVTDNANTAFPQVRVGFATATTPTTTGVVLTHPGLPAGGGVSRGDGSGILGVGADDEDLRITCGAPTGGSIRILVSYFTCES